MLIFGAYKGIHTHLPVPKATRHRVYHVENRCFIQIFIYDRKVFACEMWLLRKPSMMVMGDKEIIYRNYSFIIIYIKIYIIIRFL